jgi:hypothetical protein
MREGSLGEVAPITNWKEVRIRRELRRRGLATNSACHMS